MIDVPHFLVGNSSAIIGSLGSQLTRAQKLFVMRGNNL